MPRRICFGLSHALASSKGALQPPSFTHSISHTFTIKCLICTAIWSASNSIIAQAFCAAYRPFMLCKMQQNVQHYSSPDTSLTPHDIVPASSLSHAAEARGHKVWQGVIRCLLPVTLLLRAGETGCQLTGATASCRGGLRRPGWRWGNPGCRCLPCPPVCLRASAASSPAGAAQQQSLSQGRVGYFEL